MMKFELEKYKLIYREAKTGGTAFELKPKDSLQTKALNYGFRLIYIVKNKAEVLYVGEAKSRLKIRLQRGFTAYRYFKRNKDTARRGYQGYKWAKLLEPNDGTVGEKLEVIAILFDEEFTKRYDIEAVEGELVYLVREITGAWPTYQNEIHFNNQNQEAAVTARKIIKEIGLYKI